MKRDLMTAYHARSDHGRDGAPMHSLVCNCLELFAAHDIEIREDERERLACEAEERGDIGKDGFIKTWVWLRSESAATCTPKSWVRQHLPHLYITP